MIDVIFEDDLILVVNKPAGIAVLPERWEHETEDLFNLLKKGRPGLVLAHRIDKETSGLLVCAKAEASARALNKGFEQRSISKKYTALLTGRASWDTQVCEQALLPDADRQHRTVVSASGKPCTTVFTVIERFRSHTLVAAEPKTGRTHQIRVHAATLGFPLAGDVLYGGKPLLLSELKTSWRGDRYAERPLMGRTSLHASFIDMTAAFKSGPGEIAVTAGYRFEAPLPKDFIATCNQLRKLGT